MVRLLNLSRFIEERSQVFNLRAAENNRSFAAFFQKKLADRNVCSRPLNLVLSFLFFIEN